MSDIRFIIVGIVLVFSGFIIIGVFGENYQASNVETSEFEKCFDYSNNEEPIEIDCSDKILGQTIFLGIVFVIIGLGIVSWIKGIKGDWDSKVKPEDMVGPGRDSYRDENNSDGK